MITLTPAAATYVRAALDLDDAMENGGMVNANALIDAVTAAKANLVAEGWTVEDIAVLADNFL